MFLKEKLTRTKVEMQPTKLKKKCSQNEIKMPTIRA